MKVLHALWTLLLCPNVVYMGVAPEITDTKVLILGGGMAGMTAAKKLHDSGMTDFLVLEGSARIGGRIMEASVGDFTVELGALWIYGKGSNPVYKLAQESNLSFASGFADEWTVRNDVGEDVTDAADTLYDELDAVLGKVDVNSKKSEACDITDYSFRSALRNLQWIPKSDLADTVESYMIDFEMGIPPMDFSGKKYRHTEPHDTYGSDEIPTVNDKDGFSKIVRKMHEAIRSADKTRVLLNKVVTKIEHSNDNVKVLTKDGSTYTADYVIVTFSVGVLQEREVKFQPELPQWKSWAIDKFGMSPFIHIYLHFDTAFWDNTFEIVFNSQQRGKHSLWTNMNFVYPNSNILQLSVLSEDAIRMEKLQDSEIIEELLAILRQMYPQKSIPQPVNFAMKRWLSDPLYRGAWSYLPVSFTDTDFMYLSSPVGRVHFAGEYIHPVYDGFVNSAYESGSNTARVVLSCINKNDACQTDMNISNDIDVFGGSCNKQTSDGQRLVTFNVIAYFVINGVWLVVLDL